MTANMNRFHVQKHHVQSVVQNKVSLSCYDDKRYLLDDSVSSLAHGHYGIKQASHDWTPGTKYDLSKNKSKCNF